MKLLTDFVYLQLLDILTTVAFLMQGVAEGNPFVRWALSDGQNPLHSLILIKAASVALAIYCGWARHRALRIANIFFAGLVAYNLVAIILSAPALQNGTARTLVANGPLKLTSLCEKATYGRADPHASCRRGFLESEDFAVDGAGGALDLLDHGRQGLPDGANRLQRRTRSPTSCWTPTPAGNIAAGSAGSDSHCVV